MKPPNASDFPRLQQVFSGYLHEDFLHDHGSPASALRAFQEDADSTEREEFVAEVRRFLELTASLDFNEVRNLIARLGGRWRPHSRKALVALLSAIADPRTPRPGS
jgi:CdiI immunity protein